MELTDRHYVVLLGVRDHESIRDMSITLDKSIGTVQLLEKDLVAWGLIEKKDPTKVRASPYRLTRTGVEELRNHGYHVLS